MVLEPAEVKLKDSPAFKIAVSLSIATGLYGISFGALSVASGFDFWQTMALSLLLFSGGSQFAFIGVVAGGGSGVAAMTASALLGLRNGIYGMQMNAMLRRAGGNVTPRPISPLMNRPRRRLDSRMRMNNAAGSGLPESE